MLNIFLFTIICITLSYMYFCSRYILIICSILTICNSYSQVYSTPELKAKEEKEYQEKLQSNPDVEILKNNSSENNELFITENSNHLKIILKKYPGYYKLKSIKLDSLNKNENIESLNKMKNEVKSIKYTESAWLSFVANELIFVKLETGKEGRLEFEIIGDKIKFTCRTCEINDFIISYRSKKKVILLTKEPDGDPCYHKYTFKKFK